jgi:hypothetical protein
MGFAKALVTTVKYPHIAERSSSHTFQSETAPVKGPLGLIPIAVTALFDDYRPVAAAVSIPAAVPAAMEAAVVLTELGACAAKVIAIAEPDPITVAADADADAEIFSAGYGRCRNCNRRQGCKRKTKFSHVPSSSRNCPREKRWNRTLVPTVGPRFLINSHSCSFEPTNAFCAGATTISMRVKEEAVEPFDEAHVYWSRVITRRPAHHLNFSPQHTSRRSR